MRVRPTCEAPRVVGCQQSPEGCGLSGRPQAVAFCRVNRAQPTNRASGVSCTAWLDGLGSYVYSKMKSTVLM